MEELKRLLAFVIKLITAINTIASDGKLTFWELLKLRFIFKEVPGLLANWPTAKDAIENMTEDKMHEINLYVMLEFDIPNDKTEAVIEKAFSILLNIFSLINLVRG